MNTFVYHVLLRKVVCNYRVLLSSFVISCCFLNSNDSVIYLCTMWRHLTLWLVCYSRKRYDVQSDTAIAKYSLSMTVTGHTSNEIQEDQQTTSYHHHSYASVFADEFACSWNPKSIYRSSYNINTSILKWWGHIWLRNVSAHCSVYMTLYFERQSTNVTGLSCVGVIRCNTLPVMATLSNIVSSPITTVSGIK